MSVTLQGLSGDALLLAGPVLAAAGCAGDPAAFCGAGWAAGLGAVVTRSVALRARRMPSRGVEEAVGGVLYPVEPLADGLDRVLRHAASWPGLPAPVIVSVWGESAAELSSLAAELGPLPGVAALELNLVGAAGEPEDARWTARATEAAVAVGGCPVLVKLSMQGDPAARAHAAREGGACAVTLGHGRPAARADGTSALLAGPAIWPQTLGMVLSVVERTSIAVVACGGAATAAQVTGLLAAGASAVQLGSALLRDPRAGARATAAVSLLDPSAEPQ